MKQVLVINCPKCGRKTPAGNFCGECGSMLDKHFEPVLAVTVCPLLITTSLTSENAFWKCMSSFLTAFCTGLSIYLMGIVKPGKTSSMGREPKDLLREEVLKHHRDTGCNIKLYELENLQRKIDNLEKENAAKSKQLKTALYATLFLVFLCLIVASFD